MCCLSTAKTVDITCFLLESYKNTRTIHEKSELLHDKKCVRIFCLYQRHYILILQLKANASKFTIIDGKIMPALTSISGLGEKAAQSMANAIRNGEVSCVDDLKAKTFVSEKMLNELDSRGIFGDLPKSNQLSLFDTLKRNLALINTRPGKVLKFVSAQYLWDLELQKVLHLV